MKRRTRLAAALVALVVTGSIVASGTRHQALAADPLSQAKQQQQQLQTTLAQQRAALATLKAKSASLATQLATARAQLAAVTAEYERVRGLLADVSDQVAEIRSQLADLKARIAALDAQLDAVAAEIDHQTTELHAREDLLQDHLRSAYEQSQTSLLEVMLSARSLDQASTQVSYMLNMSGQDTALANEIRGLRDELQVKQQTLRDGRAQLADARAAAEEQAALLKQRQKQLATMTARLAELKQAADAKRRAQESALNAALQAKGDVAAAIARNEKAAAATDQLVRQLQAEAAARQRQIEEAKRRAAQRAAELARQRALQPKVSARGFRWPEAIPNVTQEWGPTTFELEPGGTYNGVWYPHFHGGIDMAAGCGAPILAAGTGVVARSGQPSWPFDSAYGVIIDHGGGVMTLYWHLQPRVVVQAGQSVTIGQVIGYEGTTGNSTGCHLHFGVNDNGAWQNPRAYLP